MTDCDLSVKKNLLEDYYLINCNLRIFKEQGMGQVMGECIAFCVRDPEFDSQM